MTELKAVKAATSATETLLVVDAMTGQEAAALTDAFNRAVDITGAVLTKMDGDSRGGAALSVREVSGKPIKFMGTGEKLEALEPFYPERMTSRILGMGDILSLVEKAQRAVRNEEAAEIQKRMMEAQFDFNDFLKQAEMVSGMGSMQQIMKMLPGMQGVTDRQLEEAEKSFKCSKALIQSMTADERVKPELVAKSASRRRRIARGAGRTDTEARPLVLHSRTHATIATLLSVPSFATRSCGDPLPVCLRLRSTEPSVSPPNRPTLHPFFPLSSDFEPRRRVCVDARQDAGHEPPHAHRWGEGQPGAGRMRKPTNVTPLCCRAQPPFRPCQPNLAGGLASSFRTLGSVCLRLTEGISPHELTLAPL